MRVAPEQLLSEEYGRQRSQLIGAAAIQPQPGIPPRGGTVYLAAADGQGNMVSFIQSNYMGFGSGLVVPGTGIALQNRGHNFSLDPSHDNALAPGKHTYHTIIPGFLTRDGRPVGPFGVMGGFMQPQGHLQVVMNCVDFGLNPQAALDAPAGSGSEGKTVLVEHGFPAPLPISWPAVATTLKLPWTAAAFDAPDYLAGSPKPGSWPEPPKAAPTVTSPAGNRHEKTRPSGLVFA